MGSSKNMAGVFFVVATTVMVVGCDAVASLVGLKKPEVVRRDGPRPTTSTPAPTPTPRKDTGGSTATEGQTPTPTPTTAPTTAPSPTPRGRPWIKVRLLDAGNGVKEIKVAGYGGFSFAQNVDLWTIHSVDGDMYIHVGDWRVNNRASSINWVTDEIRGVAWTFRISRLSNTAAELDLFGENPVALADNALGASWSHDRRWAVVKDALAALPATPSWDVVALPATSSAAATLSASAEARWGGGELMLAGLPFFPGELFPRYYELPGPNSLGGGTWTTTRGIEASHAVGPGGVALAFRYKEYIRECYRGDCEWVGRGRPAGPLWRLNKGQAAWKPLQVIPKPRVYEYGVHDHQWSQVWWSDLHQTWFVWVGAATGSIYIFDDTAAAALP